MESPETGSPNRRYRDPGRRQRPHARYLNRGNARILRAILQRLGNAGSYRTAWWAREKSQLCGPTTITERCGQLGCFEAKRLFSLVPAPRLLQVGAVYVALIGKPHFRLRHQRRPRATKPCTSSTICAALAVNSGEDANTSPSSCSPRVRSRVPGMPAAFSTRNGSSVLPSLTAVAPTISSCVALVGEASNISPMRCARGAASTRSSSHLVASSSNSSAIPVRFPSDR